jgi:hypothetical protein
MIDRSCLIVPGTCPAVQHYRMGITVPKFTGALDVCLEHIITCFAYVHLYAYLGKKPTKHWCLYHIYICLVKRCSHLRTESLELSFKSTERGDENHDKDYVLACGIDSLYKYCTFGGGNRLIVLTTYNGCLPKGFSSIK